MRAQLRAQLRTRLLAILLLLGLGGPLAAQEAAAPAAIPPTTEPAVPVPEAIVVRQSLDPASGAVIGQHVALMVDVLFRDQMPRPPRVSLPEVAGVQALRFETQGTTLRETIGGAAYVGQRFEFALYARRGGTLAIPPAAVVLLDRDGQAAGTATGQAVAMEVGVPPGVDPSQPLVATRQMRLSEQWTPDPTGPFKAGDALVRTIVRTAEDVPGLAMHDLAFPAPEGVRAYADPPDITDHSNRGVVTGRRMDRVTYVFERGGTFALPTAEQPWWDLGARTLRTARAPGATIAVAATPAASDARRPKAALWAAGVALLAILALVAIGLRRRRTAGDAEPQAFARLSTACAGADAAAVYRAFTAWRRFLDGARARAAAEALAPLDAVLFAGRPADWDQGGAKTLLESAARLRRRPRSGCGRDSLPPLNP